MATSVVGVLALQGAFAKHVEVLNHLGVTTREVRCRTSLEECDALVIPGGESTTMSRHIAYKQMEEPLRAFFSSKPVFGTCAGLILISREVLGGSIKPFDLLDIVVDRNAFGPQIHSFSSQVDLNLDHRKPYSFRAIFIRAPRVKHVAPTVQVLASYQGEPILMRQGHYLGATFHPELTQDPTIHLYFLKHCLGR